MLSVQIFVEPVARHQELSAAMNEWFAQHPGLEIEEEEVQIFHNHTTNADDLLVMLFYSEKPPRSRPPKTTPPM
jgi:hypothetical protein